MSKGYWQIPVAEKDVAKTAFVTPDGTYEYIRMPFGMVNSGATLARRMRKLIDDLDDVDNYVDDIIVHTETWEGHLVALDELFHRLSEAKLTARPTKCVMGAKAIEVIGHRVLVIGRDQRSAGRECQKDRRCDPTKDQETG